MFEHNNTNTNNIEKDKLLEASYAYILGLAMPLMKYTDRHVDEDGIVRIDVLELTHKFMPESIGKSGKELEAHKTILQNVCNMDVTFVHLVTCKVSCT